MTDLTPDRLAELTSRALERTAFMMSDPAEVDPAALDNAPYSAVIRYTGTASGSVTLRAGDSLLCTLAANLLGVEPSDVVAETQGTDALKELANIVGGSVIEALGGRDAAFHLGLPQIAPPGPAAAPVGARSCCLDCEGQPLFVTWSAAAA